MNNWKEHNVFEMGIEDKISGLSSTKEQLEKFITIVSHDPKLMKEAERFRDILQNVCVQEYKVSIKKGFSIDTIFYFRSVYGWKKIHYWNGKNKNKISLLETGWMGDEIDNVVMKHASKKWRSEFIFHELNQSQKKIKRKLINFLSDDLENAIKRLNKSIDEIVNSEPYLEKVQQVKEEKARKQIIPFMKKYKDFDGEFLHECVNLAITEDLLKS
jgi:hypothetical protein